MAEVINTVGTGLTDPHIRIYVLASTVTRPEGSISTPMLSARSAP